MSCTVPVEQLPDIMRAVGYYPSEEEVSLCLVCVCVCTVCTVCTVLVACVAVQIGNMLNEVKFSNYISSKVFKTQIDLGDTLKCKQSHPHTPHIHPRTHPHTHTVYINHRPAFGLSPGQFLQAFKALGQRSGDEYTVDRTTLLELLQEKGVLVCVYTSVCIVC